MNYLRDGEIKVPNDTLLIEELLCEAIFYQLHDLVGQLEELVPKKHVVSSTKDSPWCFAWHPKLGVGFGIIISEDGLTISKNIVHVPAWVLGNIELKENNVYYWELSFQETTKNSSVGKKDYFLT